MPNNKPTSPQTQEINFSEPNANNNESASANPSSESGEYVSATPSPIQDRARSSTIPYSPPSLDEPAIPSPATIKYESDSSDKSASATPSSESGEYVSATPSPIQDRARSSTIPYSPPSLDEPAIPSPATIKYESDSSDKSASATSSPTRIGFESTADSSLTAGMLDNRTIPTNRLPTRRNLLEQLNAAGEENQDPNNIITPGSGKQVAGKKQRESRGEGGC